MRPCLKQTKLCSGPVWSVTLVIRALSKVKQEDYSGSEVSLGDVCDPLSQELFPCCVRTPDNSNSRKGSVYFGSQCEDRVQGGGDCTSAGTGGSWSPCSCFHSQEADVKAGTHLSAWDPRPQNDPPIFMVGLLTSINQSRNALIDMPKVCLLADSRSYN